MTPGKKQKQTKKLEELPSKGKLLAKIYTRQIS